MSLKVGTEQALRASAAYNKGKVSVHGLNALLDALKYGDSGDDGPVANPKVAVKTAQTSTPSEVKGSSGVLYGVRCLSGTLSEAGSSASSDCIVYLLDDTVIVGAVLCGANEDAEAYFFGGSGAVGVNIATSLKVKATQADGSSDPAVADRPDVKVIYA